MPSIPSRTATLSTDPTLIGHPGHIAEKNNSQGSVCGSTPPYQLSVGAVATEYDVDTEAGLDDDQARDRLQRLGPNVLEGGEGVSWARVLISQLGTPSFRSCSKPLFIATPDNAMVLVMIVALVVSLAIRSWIEGGVIAGTCSSVGHVPSWSHTIFYRSDCAECRRRLLTAIHCGTHNVGSRYCVNHSMNLTEYF